jgi:hypothetical protein
MTKIEHDEKIVIAPEFNILPDFDFRETVNEHVTMCCVPFLDKTKTHFTTLKNHIRNHFMNQVELMAQIMPDWAGFLSGFTAYGHFTFCSPNSDDISVHLAIFLKQTVSNTGSNCVLSLDDHTLRKEIQQIFELHGCRVRDINIKYLTNSEIRDKGYHDSHIHHPLDNQRYQFFLLGLENTVKWQIYNDEVEYWEVEHHLRRYIRTNISSMINHFCETPREYLMITDSTWEQWSYIIKPFKKLGRSNQKVTSLVTNNMQEFTDHSKFHLVYRMINFVYTT